MIENKFGTTLNFKFESGIENKNRKMKSEKE
jgi:hypothetical protein